MRLMFAAAVLAGAALSFVVQPLMGGLLLPVVGGSPAVWNACLVAFQALLLAGYAYAHLVASRLSAWAQVAAHAGLLALAGAVLVRGWLIGGVPLSAPGPLAALEAAGRAGADPVWPLLVTLLAAVGVPFLALAASAPLLQRWFARAVPTADPYPLYAASNVGSLLGLAAYPFVLEPFTDLPARQAGWAVGFGLSALLTLACGVAAGRRGAAPAAADGPRAEVRRAPGAPSASAGGPLRWLALSAVPSALLVGVTGWVTTDLAPVPLLWVLPLGLYLLTFVLAFAGGRAGVAAGVALPVAAVAWALSLAAEATEPVWLLVPLHLGTFFLAALACHGALAACRPAPERLTAFYLWLACGGVLGGAAVTLLAPVVFRHAGHAEYPLALLAACALGGAARPRWVNRGAVGVALLVAAAVLAGVGAWVAAGLGPSAGRWRGVAFAAPAVLAYLLSGRPVIFAAALGAVLLAGRLAPGAHGRVLLSERNFFGVLRVTADGPFRQLVHGDTAHGRQSDDARDPDGRHLPLAYYYPSGPAGEVFRKVVGRKPEARRVGVVGLGAGALAYYARADQEWTFYEIDPAVVRLACDWGLFAFWQESRCPPGQRQVRLGDARLALRDEPADVRFDVLVLDAFSSDAVPLHLLTREAMSEYARRLAPGGVVLVHVSNRYLDLAPVVARLGASIEPPLRAWGRFDPTTDPPGRAPSHWVVLARDAADLAPLTTGPSLWDPVPPVGPLWTDRQAALWLAFKWEWRGD